MIQFVGYPKCTTCKKAEIFLNKNNIIYEYINIKEKKFSKEEINNYIILSNKDINKFFNTSGVLYRELKIKDKISDMTYEEKINILCSNGMLIKRPILVFNNNVLVGFKESEWINLINEK